LRQAARGETASATANLKSAHLDADEISAFAENALPENVKQKYTIHFADCNRCRSILSNLIALGTETEIEIPLVQTVKTEKVAAVIPWYRKLFAAPNLAYTMGALLLAFSGLIAFVVLQNNNASSGLEISQISEQAEKPQGPSFNEVPPTQEKFSNSAMSNSMSSNSSMMSNAAPNVSSTNSAPAQSETKTTTIPAANTIMSAAPKPVTSAGEPASPEIREDSFAMLPNKNNLPSQAVNANTNAAKKEEPKKTENEQTVVDTTDSAKSAQNKRIEQLPVNGRSVPSESLMAAKQKKARVTSETTSVNGKTFRRAGGVWTDSAYKEQPTTNISRGTNEYKKLDSNLRSIVENLGGTVIVVWKEKAYQIQ